MIQEIHAVRKIDVKGTRRKSERSVPQVVGSEARRTENSCAAWGFSSTLLNAPDPSQLQRF